MPQTKEMKRLLLKGKIVGYLRGMIHPKSERMVWWQFLGSNMTYPPDVPEGSIIDHDSFELGIKNGNEWWFEGDRGKDLRGEFVIYRKNDFLWYKQYGLTEYELITSNHDLKISNRIGTIHDKGEEDAD